MGEGMCCSAANGITGTHIAEALCSPNSSTPCPQAAHHTAPDCQVPFHQSPFFYFSFCILITVTGIFSLIRYMFCEIVVFVIIHLIF